MGWISKGSSLRLASSGAGPYSMCTKRAEARAVGLATPSTRRWLKQLSRPYLHDAAIQSQPA